MFPVDSETKRLVQDYINENIDTKDVYYGSEEDPGEYGIERNTHVTIVYGYTSDKIDAIADSFKKYPEMEISMTLGKVGYFQHKNYYVLYVEVDSDDLKLLNKLSTESGIKIESSYPDYHPHCTLAYIKPDSFRNYKHLIGDNYFEGIESTGTKIKITTSSGEVGYYELP